MLPRFNLSSEAELKRPTSNLVKIASHVKDKPCDMMNHGDQHTTMTDSRLSECVAPCSLVANRLTGITWTGSEVQK